MIGAKVLGVLTAVIPPGPTMALATSPPPTTRSAPLAYTYDRSPAASSVGGGVLDPLIEAGLVATCGLIEFELAWAARTSAELDELRADLYACYEWSATQDEDCGGRCTSRRSCGGAGRCGRSGCLTCWCGAL